MLTAQRRALILDVLTRDGQLIAKDLAAELDLSDDTIRRDLRELAADGKLQRVHGGALPASPAIADFSVRRHVATEGKTAVGRARPRSCNPVRRSSSTAARRPSSSLATYRSTSRRP